jgi:hypothetical protein
MIPLMSIKIAKKLLERFDFTVKLRSIRAIEVPVSKEVCIELEVMVSVGVTTVVFEVSAAVGFQKVFTMVLPEVSKE